jgi:hypothetical protein
LLDAIIERLGQPDEGPGELGDGGHWSPL